MKIILCIGLGGFFGAIARYGMTAGVQHWIGGRLGDFPVGTLTVNLLGCLVLGFIGHLLSERFEMAAEIRFALTVGFLGAFTTFSTYAYETLAMAREGEHLVAWINLLASNTLGLFAVWAGYRLGGLV
ncbi:MAG: fluoride efflux transporter CrcB [Kiritimatiellales bacterium]